MLGKLIRTVILILDMSINSYTSDMLRTVAAHGWYLSIIDLPN